MPYNGQLFIWTGQNNVHLFDYLGLKNKQTGGGGGTTTTTTSLISLVVSVDVSFRP